MTKYEVIYHNAETDNECEIYVNAGTLTKALNIAWSYREDGEYVYITNPETGETFLTDDGATLAVVPEV